MIGLMFVARYLQPMASFAREIQAYKYYVEESGNGDRSIMDQRVYEEKKKAPARYSVNTTVSIIEVVLPISSMLRVVIKLTLHY